jgi:hypothetical protein
VTRAAAIPQRPEESFTALDSPSLQYLPRQEEAQGWRLEEDPLVLPPDRLAQYIDQDAAHFRKYDVVDTTVGKYVSTTGSGFATVEIYRFPDFVKAFGAYSMRRVGPVQPFDLANEAFTSRHGVHLWRGPFYVRIVGGGTADGVESLKRLAAYVAERMPAAPAKPAVFNFFPVDTRVPNSERFSADSGFDLAMFANSFQASFNVGGNTVPVRGVIIPAANREASRKLLDAYRALYVANGRILDPVINLGEDSFTAEDKYLGRAVAFRIDRFVIAFNGYEDRDKLVGLAIATDTRILGTIRKQLVTADKQAEAAAEPQKQDNRPGWVR